MSKPVVLEATSPALAASIGALSPSSGGLKLKGWIGQPPAKSTGTLPVEINFVTRCVFTINAIKATLGLPKF